MLYLCSLPNAKTAEGAPKFLHSDDDGLIVRWIRAENRPGFGVYYCPNPLKPGATRHGKDSIGAIETVFVDVDFKNIVETAEQAKEKIHNGLLVAPTIVDSGHGLHLSYTLKEAIPHDHPHYARACTVQEKLVHYFAADPQVRPWSLLRLPGTINSKEDPHVPCEVVTKAEPVDLTELEELCELVEGSTLLTRKEILESNGQGHAEGAPRTSEGPLDYAAEWTAMANGKSCNDVQSRIILSMLRKGVHPQDVYEYVVNATMTIADQSGFTDKQGNKWTREAEKTAVHRRIVSDLNGVLQEGYDHRTGVIPVWLPGAFHERWAALLLAGKRPYFQFANGSFYLKPKPGAGADADDKGNTTEEQGKPGAIPSGNVIQQPPLQLQEPPQKALNNPRALTLRPFKRFDVTKLPQRSWLYGKHYQRRTVSLTAGPGGMGKSSNDMVEAIAMATGRNLLGEQPEERLRVWYHNGEDPREEIDRRLAAICQHHDIPQEELEGWLWTTGRNFHCELPKATPTWRSTPSWCGRSLTPSAATRSTSAYLTRWLHTPLRV
jgi:AAA domain